MKKLTLFAMMLTLFSVTTFAHQKTRITHLRSNVQRVVTSQSSKPGLQRTEDELTPVVAPENLVTAEYSLKAYDSKEEVFYCSVQVGFDGTDVYIQGLSSYLPESWIKGSLSENTVTFPGSQYIGSVGDYDFFLNYEGEDVVFTYDAETGTFTAVSEEFCIDNDIYYFDDFVGAVLTKVVEKAATPANPLISVVADGDYGWYMYFSIPTLDTEGEGLSGSKLFYQIFVEEDGEVSPLTFTPATHSELDEELSVIPFGFTDSYDFYRDCIYFNNLFSTSWTKIGIQSIYTGGGEEHKSEIFWFEIEAVASSVALFDFNSMDVEVSTNTSHAGDIKDDLVLTDGTVTLTVSPAVSGTPNRFWNDSKNGIQLRVYSGTLTFEAPQGMSISQIVFNYGKWNDGNDADSGEFDGSTWTGSANTVVVTIAGNTQLNSIEVTLAGGAGSDVQYDETVAPDDLETEEWAVTANEVDYSYDEELGESIELIPFTSSVNLGLYSNGSDVYIQGLCPLVPEAWVKGTLADGKVTIPSGTFLGQYFDDWGELGLIEENLFITAADIDGEEETLTDIVFNYNAETKTLTTEQDIFITVSPDELEYYYWFQNMSLSFIPDVAATPAQPSVSSAFISSQFSYLSLDIPATDAEGNALLSSNLFYVLWIEKNGEVSQLTLYPNEYEKLDEELSEFPYNFTDDNDILAHGAYILLNQSEEELASWTKIGVQSIYRGGGEEHKSEISWFEPEVYGDDDAVRSVAATTGKTAIYNLSGQRVAKAQKGFYIAGGRKIVVK